MAIPMLAHHMGRTRERPSLWKEPNPTPNAPLAANIPAAGNPTTTPVVTQMAMATVHGIEETARFCFQSALNKSRTARRSMHKTTTEGGSGHQLPRERI